MSDTSVDLGELVHQTKTKLIQAVQSTDPEFLDIKGLAALTDITLKLEASLKDDSEGVSLGAVLKGLSKIQDC